MVLSGADYGRDDLREIEDGTQTGEGVVTRSIFKSMVWKRNYVLSGASKYFTRKLAPKYVGPYYIKKRLSPWTYELRDVDGNSKGSWHVKDLKPSLQD
ncbi:hypothetical protein JTB14_016399 [Gonioctena quinquepunctata]|nr:hypothetical protein JTB14_016399 [Gonioctena quinquepunctata]